jgi:hypothetical protein|tara:strand:- start:354 stop:650 length:297 start_codon:yes stop_codon:yes gene_type:complete
MQLAQGVYKMAKANTATHKPGTTTVLSTSVIKLVPGASNPASKGSDRNRRFALMANGLTVGQWYAACRNSPNITGRAHNRLVAKAVSKGYITLTPPKA